MKTNTTRIKLKGSSIGRVLSAWADLSYFPSIDLLLIGVNLHGRIYQLCT